MNTRQRGLETEFVQDVTCHDLHPGAGAPPEELGPSRHAADGTPAMLQFPEQPAPDVARGACQQDLHPIFRALSFDAGCVRIVAAVRINIPTILRRFPVDGKSM
jgi:hypothetical protein